MAPSNSRTPDSDAADEAALDAAVARLGAALARLDVLPGSAEAEAARAVLEERRRLLCQALPPGREPRPLLVALVGGTNVGKSTIFNMAVGGRIACPSELARGTRAPVVHVHAGRRAALEASAVLAGYQRVDFTEPERLNEDQGETPRVFISEHREGALEAVALADSPDLDSDHQRNHAVARDLLFSSDAVIFVTSNQKYRDEICERFMARAAALGRRVTAVFNFASPKAVEDFRERTRRLTGRELHDHRLVTLPFLKPDDPRRASGAAEVRELLAGLIAAAPRIRAEARAGAALALPAELRPVLERHRDERRAIDELRSRFEVACESRARAWSRDARQAGIPEMDEVMAMVMKELSVPGIDAVYDAIFETARGVFARLRRFAGGADTERIREQRDKAEEERVARHANGLVEDLRERLLELDSHPGLRALVPAEVTRRLEGEDLAAFTREWRAARREIITDARDRILADLRERRLLNAFLKAGKVALRATSIVTIFHFGPQPLVDIGGSAAADLGLRVVLDRVFGHSYQARTEDRVVAALESCYAERLRARSVDRLDAALPESHRPGVFAELESAVAAVRSAGRALRTEDEDREEAR